MKGFHMKTLTIKIDIELYKRLKNSCPKDMKITYFYIELLKNGLVK